MAASTADILSGSSPKAIRRNNPPRIQAFAPRRLRGLVGHAADSFAADEHVEQALIHADVVVCFVERIVLSPSWSFSVRVGLNAFR